MAAAHRNTSCVRGGKTLRFSWEQRKHSDLTINYRESYFGMWASYVTGGGVGLGIVLHRPGLQVFSQQRIYFLPWGQAWQAGCDLQWTQSCLKRLRIMTPWDKAQGCQILTNRQAPQFCRGQIPGMGTCESVQRGPVLDTPSSRVFSCPPESSWTQRTALLPLLMCIGSGCRTSLPTPASASTARGAWWK